MTGQDVFNMSERVGLRNIRKKLQLFPRLRGSGALLFGLLISGCVSNTTLPSQNLGTLLTPAKGDQVAKTADPQQVKQATAPTVAEAKATEGDLSPAVRSALVPAEKAPTAAEKATKTIAENSEKSPAETVKPETVKTEKAKSAPPAQSETQVAKLEPAKSPVAKPATQATAVKKQDTPKKPRTSLFGNFFKSNEAGSRRAKSDATVTRSKRPRRKIVARLRNRGSASGLPGVRKDAIFGIDTEEVEELDEPIRVASVTNLARRGSHGLLLQRKGVQVACFPPKLVRLLKQVERRFGRTPIVTSGYRSRAYNRRIRGARNSMHIRCLAADIQVKGVSKWTLAKYLRKLPGRGGVGTYCHTRSVHIDIAGKRDWNRRCRRSRRRRS